MQRSRIIKYRGARWRVVWTTIIPLEWETVLQHAHDIIDRVLNETA